MRSKIRKCKVGSFVSKIALTIGLMMAFYKLPGKVADKISYIQIKRKKFR